MELMRTFTTALPLPTKMDITYIYGEFNKNRKRKNSVKREKVVQYKSQSPEQEE